MSQTFVNVSDDFFFACGIDVTQKSVGHLVRILRILVVESAIRKMWIPKVILVTKLIFFMEKGNYAFFATHSRS